MKLSKSQLLSIIIIGLLSFTLSQLGTGIAAESASEPQVKVSPRTLAELLALSAEQLEKCDLARMNLLCAEGLRGSENLDVQACLDRLEGWAVHVERETKRNFHHFLERPKEFNNALPYYYMGMLGTVLAEDLRIQYNPEHERRLREGSLESRSVEQWDKFFSSSTDIFIHGLLSGKRHGTCASMPFLYAAIGRRLGYPVTIAARKHHLYVRYEMGDGEHMNMEATEHLGFSTPTDAEYRNGPFPMTQEEIDGCGWLRPLSNKEILAICLFNRANCLRSMKRYDEEIATLAQAARYAPDTALMRRVIEKNQQLARNLRAADRWDELWDELENLSLPTAGPMFEHFHNRRLRAQFSMNQSTNLAEIEKNVSRLKDDLARYRSEISDDPAKVGAAFGQRTPVANQEIFLALLADGLFARRVRIPQEGVPFQYRSRIPPELQQRLRKLNTEREIIEEMNVYSAEEFALHGNASLFPMEVPPVPPVASPFGQPPQVKISPQDMPMTWRGRAIPPELNERLASVSTIREESVRRMRIRDEMNRFYIDQDQRRFRGEAIQKRRAPLDQEPLTRPPLQIEVVLPSAPAGAEASTPNSPLTEQPQPQTTPATRDTGKP